MTPKDLTVEHVVSKRLFLTLSVLLILTYVQLPELKMVSELGSLIFVGWLINLVYLILVTGGE